MAMERTRFFLLGKERLVNLLGYPVKSQTTERIVLNYPYDQKITLTEYTFREEVVQGPGGELVTGRMGTKVDLWFKYNDDFRKINQHLDTLREYEY